MELGHIAITLVLLLNTGLLAWIAINLRTVSKQAVKANDESEQKSGPTVEIRYFDYIEDHQGAVKNSKRFIVKAQVFVAGLPSRYRLSASTFIRTKLRFSDTSFLVENTSPQQLSF